MTAVGELLSLDGRVAIITGASGGIGEGIATRFAEAGARVAVCYQTDEEAAGRLAARIQERGGQAAVFQVDVTDAVDVESLVRSVETALGPPDILVNNAGVYPGRLLLEMSADEWDETMDANVRGVFLCTRAVAVGMKERNGGAIVNIASIEGHVPAKLHTHYATSKAAVLMHTRAAAQELGRHDIRVNAVSPGLIHRAGIEESWPQGVERWLGVCPLGRLGRADDVADACLFLASDAARWITGADLVVDGGALTRPTF